MIQFSVSASRNKLLTRLPQEAIELLGGRSTLEALTADRTIHTLSTGGVRLIQGQALDRAMFDDFLRVIPGDGRSTRWAGELGDDFLSHNFSWLRGRSFGFGLAVGGDVLIQWFWPGSGDVWNYQEYGLTPGKFWGRAGVAAGGGLLAWGGVEVATAIFVAGGVIAAPAEMPFIAGAAIFVGVEFAYEWQVKPRLYEWLDLKGTSEP